MANPKDTTRKIKAVTAEDELQAARTACMQAYETYAAQKTIVNLKAMIAAQDYLQEVKKLYDEGRRLKNHSVLPRKE